MYGIKIESPIERIPMKGLIRIMMTDGLYGIFPHGDITIAVYETMEYAKKCGKGAKFVKNFSAKAEGRERL